MLAYFQVEKRDKENEADDVESNLLLPPGAALRWVTFLLKIYRAEDIPQSMEPFLHNELVPLVRVV